MRYKLFALLLVFPLLLTACSEAVTTEAPLEETEVDTGDGAISIYQPPEGTATPLPTAAPPVFEASAPAMCSVVSQADTLAFPESVSYEWSRGPEDAPITIVEYSDFQCPFCAVFTENLKAVYETFPDDVRVVFRHFPLLSIHPNAGPAIQAAEAAGRQDKFWEMHDLLFINQDEWSSLSTDEVFNYFSGLAAELELETIQFETDMNDQEIVDIIQQSWDDAAALGIPGTPAVLINGEVIQTSLESDDLINQINIALNSDQMDVTDSDWTLGPDDASITLIEYTDIQCPYCSQSSAVISQLVQDFPDDLRVVFRHFPLDEIHPNARLAGQAAEAAGYQEMFWEMSDHLFADQASWSELETEAFMEYLGATAEELGLDTEQFFVDLVSDKAVEKVNSDYEVGLSMGVQGTPAFYIDGEAFTGPTDYYSLTTLFNLLLLDEIQFTECPPMEIDPEKEYYATMHTDKGDIVFQLFPDLAPMAVNNFIFLAENGWYEDTTFHRVLPGFIAQGGDPTGTGYGSPGFAYDIEVTPELLFDREGLLAMANAGPTSNGSQFFITFDNPDIIQLSGQYTIFGIVIEGMELVYELTPRNPSSDGTILPPGDNLLGVTIEIK